MTITGLPPLACRVGRLPPHLGSGQPRGDLLLGLGCIRGIAFLLLGPHGEILSLVADLFN